MDTKTRKQEALALLALDTMTDEQEAELNLLTMNQAYPGLQERWQATGTTTPILIPRYRDSVDDCLMLISEYRYVIHHSMGSFRIRVYRDTSDAEGIYVDARSLPVAMLKAWWQTQD